MWQYQLTWLEESLYINLQHSLWGLHLGNFS